jgi:hypothetical protein
MTGLDDSADLARFGCRQELDRSEMALFGRSPRRPRAMEVSGRSPITAPRRRRLQLYRGAIGPEAVVTATDTEDVQIATLAYGLDNWYLMRGDKAEARKNSSARFVADLARLAERRPCGS